MATLRASVKSDQSCAAPIGTSEEVTKPAEMAQDPLQGSIGIWFYIHFKGNNMWIKHFVADWRTALMNVKE